MKDEGEAMMTERLLIRLIAGRQWSSVTEGPVFHEHSLLLAAVPAGLTESDAHVSITERTEYQGNSSLFCSARVISSAVAAGTVCQTTF